MGAVVVKGVVIGEGIPKVCVPILGAQREELREEAQQALALGAEVVELRIDHFSRLGDPSLTRAAIEEVAEILGEIPLLFTFRTVAEGGRTPLDTEAYAALNRLAFETGAIDLLDVELSAPAPVRDELITMAHRRGVPVVVSSHDFRGTPPEGELVARLVEAARIGGDLPKVAVMPKSEADVLTLLSATLRARKELGNAPLVTVAMGPLGTLTRFCGELFGSALTFGAGVAASAPGQIPVPRLRTMLDLFHQSMS